MAVRAEVEGLEETGMVGPLMLLNSGPEGEEEVRAEMQKLAEAEER